MRYSANNFSLDEKNVLLSEEVKPRATPLYTVLLAFISLAAYSAFWMVPLPRVIYRIMAVLIGSALFLVMMSSALRRTAVSFQYVLTRDQLLVFRILYGRKKPFTICKLETIERMDRFGAGLPRGKYKNACVSRLPACEKGVFLLTEDFILLLEPTEAFARALSHAAAERKNTENHP